MRTGYKMKYYIGVDGGGTKTAICAASEDATEILSGITGSASWREYGVSNVAVSIKKAIVDLPLKQDGQIAGIAMGLPYYGESEEGDKKLEKAIRETFPDIALYITNDVEAGWAGSLGLAPGINVVAGTGSIAFGKDESGMAARSGGWSEFFGDEGSCYWIGRKALEIFSKQADGRIPKDDLYDIFRKKLNLKNDIEIIDKVHRELGTNRDKVAALQLLAKDAALAGSKFAKSLYIQAAQELCKMVTAIRDQLNFKNHPYRVSYSGGLYKAGDLILPHFKKAIESEGGNPVPPKHPPMHGALLLAFEKTNPEGLTNLKKRLKKNKYGTT